MKGYFVIYFGQIPKKQQKDGLQILKEVLVKYLGQMSYKIFYNN